MTTYRGPHASVRQEFEVSPAATAIESLPPVAVATAYDVYAKEMLGLASGIASLVSPWPTSEKVVYNREVAGFRAFEFYPTRVYANTSFGYRELFGAEDGDTDIILSAAGVTVDKDAAYTLPNTEKAAGSCTAIIPFYNQTTGVTIDAGDLRTVVITGGAVATSQLKPGQAVLVLIGATWTQVGVVGTIGSDETKIKLASAYSGAVIGTQIIVGSVNTAGERDRPNMFYDASADFVAARVRPGDLVKFSSLALPTSLTTEVVASIVSIVDKNTIKFNTVQQTAGVETYEGYKYSSAAPGNTIAVYAYKIERLCGFSQNYNLAALGAPTGVLLTVVSTSRTQIEFADTAGGDAVPALMAGDIIMITDANTLPSTYLRTYIIKSIVYSVDKYIVTVDDAMNQSAISADTPIAAGDFLHAWNPKMQHDVVSDFRAIRSVEHMVTKRIASVKDITDAWSRNGEISLYNELAYMMQIEFSLSGGRVCYGINVDSSADNLSGEYAEALELLKVIDVYSHSFGTTDGGVNALMGSYCDQQADPYEGHERKAILAYDQRDVYMLGTDTGEVSNVGLVEIDGAINLMTIGLTVKDKVEVYGDDGELVATLNVTSTPTVSNQVQTDGTTAYSSGTTMRFVCNRTNAQALLVGALGAGNRRLKIVWPGWFGAQFSGESVVVPPYYIAAAVAGNDCSMPASQSFTNMDFAIPGLSSYSLGTNYYFRKSDLDEIGGGGIDVMIQDAQVSQTIKSRHDLTTNMDAVEYRENSITKQAGIAAKTLRSAVAPYVGRYNIGSSLFRFLGQICSVVCTKLVKDGLLAKLEVISITRDPVIADKINFVINATVFVAGNYYEITLYVKSR